MINSRPRKTKSEEIHAHYETKEVYIYIYMSNYFIVFTIKIFFCCFLIRVVYYSIFPKAANRIIYGYLILACACMCKGKNTTIYCVFHVKVCAAKSKFLPLYFGLWYR